MHGVLASLPWLGAGGLGAHAQHSYRSLCGRGLRHDGGVPRRGQCARVAHRFGSRRRRRGRRELKALKAGVEVEGKSPGGGPSAGARVEKDRFAKFRPFRDCRCCFGNMFSDRAGSAGWRGREACAPCVCRSGRRPRGEGRGGSVTGGELIPAAGRPAAAAIGAAMGMDACADINGPIL